MARKSTTWMFISNGESKALLNCVAVEQGCANVRFRESGMRQRTALASKNLAASVAALGGN